MNPFEILKPISKSTKYKKHKRKRAGHKLQYQKNHSFLIQSMREKFLVEEVMKNPSY